MFNDLLIYRFDYENVTIVTHSELLIQIPNCKCFTTKMDDTTTEITLTEVKEDRKFEIID